MFRRFIKTEKQRCRESGSAIASSLSRCELELSRGSATPRLFDRRGARSLFGSAVNGLRATRYPANKFVADPR